MRALLIAVVVAMTACKSSPPPTQAPPTGDPPAASDPTVEVLAAVALHELRDTDKQRPVCLATRGAQDPAAVLARLQKTFPNAIADSACHGGGPDGSSVQAPSGPGVRIDIGPATVTGEMASCNGGGAYVGGGAREIQYIVEHKGGAWSVTHEKLLSVM